MEKFELLEERLRERLPQLELRREEPMADHTTFRVGGPAALMALPRTEEELVTAVRAAAALDIWPLPVGNGSNLLVDDDGVRAFVVKTSPGMDGCAVSGTTVTAMSGIRLSQLATQAAGHGLTGLEFAHGIPGSLGGAVVMNAGAYDGETRHVVSSVRAVNRAGELAEFSGEECGFGYRRSVFSGGDWLVVSAALGLKPGDPAAITARMEELMARRRAKQPLEYPSAGSTFKRPQGHYAAALIESCGLKGVTVGGAQVSEKHSGFVINRGGATCGDILRLMELVRERVFRQTGVTLEPEVRYIK